MSEAKGSSGFWSFPFCPAPPDWRLDWPAIEESFDWVREMAGCPQDADYHAEGDVLTHTRMVCEALVSLESWRQLMPPARATVFAAALMHDVAKPAYTQVETDGSITSHGHVRNGARLVREILWQRENPATPFHYREMIAALVRYSGLPFYLLEKSDPTRAVITASMTVRHDWLSLLAEADARGRRCDDQQELLDKIELFREYCRESRCFDAPRQFASPQSRFIYFYKDKSDPDYHAFDETAFEVVLMSGLPGSGKDHWIRLHQRYATVLSLDGLRAELSIPAHKNQGAVVSEAKSRARELLRKQTPFVWNATNVTRAMRAQLIELFTAYKARVRIVYTETSYSDMLARNHAREATVPKNVIDRLAARLDIPDLTEAQEVVWEVE